MFSLGIFFFKKFSSTILVVVPRFVQLGSGHGGSILSIDPGHITKSNEDRSLVLLVDQVGANPLECVYNGARSGQIARLVSDFLVAPDGNSQYSSRRTRKVECLMPAKYMKSLNVPAVEVALQSPNSTWASNSIRVKVLRQGIPLKKAGVPAGVRGGWSTSLLPVLKGTETRGDGSFERVWKNYAGEVAYCRVGYLPPQQVTMIGGKLFCAVPHFYTVAAKSLNVQLSLDRRLFTPSDNIGALVGTYLAQNTSFFELHQVNPSRGVVGQSVVVRGVWPSLAADTDIGQVGCWFSESFLHWNV